MLAGFKNKYNTIVNEMNPKTYHSLRLSFYTLVIMISHLSSSLLLQKIYKTPYPRTNTSNMQSLNLTDTFNNPFAILIFNQFLGFLYGFSIYYIFSRNNSETNQNENQNVPTFEFIRIAVIQVFHVLASTFFLVKTSYLLVNMINSSELIAVVLIAVFCTQASSRFRVEKRQIFIAFLMCAGIIVFNYFNEEKNKDGSNQNNWIAIVILLFSLIVYSFKSELTSRIRQKYRIEASYMYYEISKFMLILGLIGAAMSNYLVPLAKFMWQHDRISLDLAMNSTLNMIGCIFVYRIIIQYKQHVVPFVISVRKLLSSLLSIYYFNSKINNIQFVGMAIVFGSILLEIWLDIRQTQQNQDKLNTEQLNAQQLK